MAWYWILVLTLSWLPFVLLVIGGLISEIHDAEHQIEKPSCMTDGWY